jgi:hypothetical protein
MKLIQNYRSNCKQYVRRMEGKGIPKQSVAYRPKGENMSRNITDRFTMTKWRSSGDNLGLL